MNKKILITVCFLIFSLYFFGCVSHPVVNVYNRTDSEINVRIEGIKPFTGPGNMAASRRENGTLAAFHSDVPVRLSDEIIIHWHVRNGNIEMQTVSFQRKELGLPKRIAIGSLDLIFTREKIWVIEQGN